jgi:hypothetical protein
MAFTLDMEVEMEPRGIFLHLNLGDVMEPPSPPAALRRPPPPHGTF